MTPFTTRNDPLVAAAKKALETGAQRRAVQKEVLEEMGGTHLRGMTNENRAKYTDEVNKRVAGPDKLDESKKKVDLVSEAETKPNRGHNSPYDRGSADAHYGRKHNPHYYKDVLGDDGKIVRRDQIKADGMHPHEIEEYTKGYQGADDFGDGKRLRHVEKAKPKNVNDVYREHVEVVAEAPVEGKHFIKTKDLSKDKTNKESDKRIKASVNAGQKKKQIDEVSDTTKQSYLKKAGKWLKDFQKAPEFEVSQKDMQREPKRVETFNKLKKKVVNEAASIEEIMAEIKANGVDADKILEGRAGGVAMIRRSPQQTPVPAAQRTPMPAMNIGNVAKRYLDSSAGISASSKGPVKAQVSNNNVPVANQNNIGQVAQRYLNNTAPSTQSSQGFDEKGFESPAPARDAAAAAPAAAAATPATTTAPERNMAAPRRTATVAPAKDPTDTAENRRFKQTYAADRTLNRDPNDRFAPDGM